MGRPTTDNMGILTQKRAGNQEIKGSVTWKRPLQIIVAHSEVFVAQEAPKWVEERRTLPVGHLLEVEHRDSIQEVPSSAVRT